MLGCAPDEVTSNVETDVSPLTATECAQNGGQCDASNTCVRTEYRCGGDGLCGFVPVSFGECGGGVIIPGGGGGGGGGGGTAAQCRCTTRVFSSNRFMRGMFDVECGGHGNHGFCRSAVDTAIHSPGCGAMTGHVRVAFGAASSQLSCQDDHRTCFRGPSSCDGGGTWANLCSCDTTGDLPAGVVTTDLFDGQEISQYTAVLTTSGACGAVDMSIDERVIEHDPLPFGRDDPLGHLTTPTFRPGVGTQTRTFNVQQTIPRTGPRGAYSGTFGATLRVETICSAL